MALLVLGLVLFLGVHSVRVFADGWRTRAIARVGANAWKGIYSLISAVGLILLVWGFGLARRDAVTLWAPMSGAPYLAGGAMLLASILITAAYIPGNHLRRWVGHPMILGVALWALVHLIANGSSVDAVFFGAFLIWAVVDFLAARNRPQATPAGLVSIGRDAIVVVIGAISWYLVAFQLHGWMTGVRPFG